jgi:hypothetical protein
MKKLLLTTGTLLALSAGGAFAAGPDVTGQPVPSANQPQGTVGAYATFNMGYVFPNSGSPSSAGPLAPPAAAGSHVSGTYLYPPADTNDDD